MHSILYCFPCNVVGFYKERLGQTSGGVLCALVEGRNNCPIPRSKLSTAGHGRLSGAAIGRKLSGKATWERKGEICNVVRKTAAAPTKQAT